MRDVIDDVSGCDEVTSQLNEITGYKTCGSDSGRSPILLQLYRLAMKLILSLDKSHKFWKITVYCKKPSFSFLNFNVRYTYLNSF